jgi:hypothetical protein
MYAQIPLALSLFAVSALAAPPHLEARKGAAPVGGPASAKVTVYSGYTCTAPNAVSLYQLCLPTMTTKQATSLHPPTAAQAQQPPSQFPKAHARSHLLVFSSEA